MDECFLAHAILQFETALGIMARVDPTTDVAMKLNDTIIGGLYDTVPHPPAAYLGPKYAWRQADGSNNSLQDPDCGRSGRPYARSVQARSTLPVTSLPDPGLVFDTLLRKRDVRRS